MDLGSARDVVSVLTRDERLVKERTKKMEVSASCKFLWGIYLFFGLFPLIYVTLKKKGGDKR